MKVYLDVSCLNRPFDDQSQERIRLEAEAVRLILRKLDGGEWQEISSEMAQIEVKAIPDPERLKNVTRLLPTGDALLMLTPEMFARAAEFEHLGLQTADALHVAAAESGDADVLLTCDDRLQNWGRRNRATLKVEIANPLVWIAQHAHP